MANLAYIFIERNFGDGYRKALPELPGWKLWLWDWRFRKLQSDGEIHGCSHTIIDRRIDDVDCKDPHAAGRSPLIICRIAIPVRIDTASIAACRWIDECVRIAKGTTRQGTDEHLTVPLPDELLPVKRGKTQQYVDFFHKCVGRMRARVFMTALGIIVLSIFAILLLAGLNWNSKATPSPPDKALIIYMYEKMNEWGIENIKPSDVNTPVLLTNRFFAFLSIEYMPKLSNIDLTSSPDTEFLVYLSDILPQKPSQFTDDNFSEIAVNDALNQLLGKMSVIPLKSNSKYILARIQERISYKMWHQNMRKTVFSGNVRLDINAHEYLKHFVFKDNFETPALIQKSTLMFVALVKWRVEGLQEEDCVKRPWYVASSFFQFMSISRMDLSKLSDFQTIRLLKEFFTDATVLEADVELSGLKIWKALEMQLSKAGGESTSTSFDGALQNVVDVYSDKTRWSKILNAFNMERELIYAKDNSASASIENFINHFN